MVFSSSPYDTLLSSGGLVELLSAISHSRNVSWPPLSVPPVLQKYVFTLEPTAMMYSISRLASAPPKPESGPTTCSGGG